VEKKEDDGDKRASLLGSFIALASAVETNDDCVQAAFQSLVKKNFFGQFTDGRQLNDRFQASR